MSPLTLAEVRTLIFAELDDEWTTTTQFQARLGLDGGDFYRVALVERLAHDGEAELQKPDTARRRFRASRDNEGS